MNQLIDYQNFTGLPSAPLLHSLLDLQVRIFEGQTQEEVKAEMMYHRQRGPFLINLAMLDAQVVGYKMGYESSRTQFYSWLGGVDPAFRGLGIADTLMTSQHGWCRQQGYQTVRTQTYNQWRPMLILNLRHGFNIAGTRQGTHGLLIMLEKQL